MTILEPKTARDNYGIDSFERGFIYAILLLRASNTKVSNKYSKAVQLIADLNNPSEDGFKSILTIQAKLPYDSQQGLLQGGNFIENIGVFGNEEPGKFLATCKPRKQPGGFLMPTEPSWVNTLERYLAWCVHSLISNYVIVNSGLTVPISSDFLEEDAEPSILIKASIEIDSITYLQDNNLMCAAIKSIGNFQATNTPVQGIENSDSVGNDSLVGN